MRPRISIDTIHDDCYGAIRSRWKHLCVTLCVYRLWVRAVSNVVQSFFLSLDFMKVLKLL